MKDNLKNIAQKTLDDFFSLIEENYEEFDVDFEEEVLKFEKDDQIYILSFHEPTSQIWLSSPISGAHHFKISSKDPLTWHSTRDKSLNLFDLISKELS